MHSAAKTSCIAATSACADERSSTGIDPSERMIWMTTTKVLNCAVHNDTDAGHCHPHGAPKNK
jgi:hypothetical protein